MLKALDFLGLMKWPSLFVVVVVPLASYVLLWGDFDRPVALRLYGPEAVGSLPMLLTHPADAGLVSDSSTRWCVRTCSRCQDRLATVEFSYGDAARSTSQWLGATPEAGARCADLQSRRPDQRFIWLRIVYDNGRRAERAWALSGPD